MKSKKLLIAGGAAVAGCVLIYMGYKYVVKPAQSEATNNANKPLTPTVTSTIVKGSSPNAAILDKINAHLASNSKPVSGLGMAYILN